MLALQAGLFASTLTETQFCLVIIWCSDCIWKCVPGSDGRSQSYSCTTNSRHGDHVSALSFPTGTWVIVQSCSVHFLILPVSRNISKTTRHHGNMFLGTSCEGKGSCCRYFGSVAATLKEKSGETHKLLEAPSFHYSEHVWDGADWVFIFFWHEDWPPGGVVPSPADAQWDVNVMTPAGVSCSAAVFAVGPISFWAQLNYLKSQHWTLIVCLHLNSKSLLFVFLNCINLSYLDFK